MKKQNDLTRIGKKIRDIEIDRYQYLFKMNLILVLMNIVLIAMMTFLMVKLRFWFVYLICVIVLILVWTFSIVTSLTAKKKINYSLHENSIVIDTTFVFAIIDLTSLVAVQEKKTLSDRIMKQGTTSLHLLTDSDPREIMIHHINEDISALIATILKLSKQAKQLKYLAHHDDGENPAADMLSNDSVVEQDVENNE